MKKIALVIGATGATGKDIVSQLLDDADFETVHVFARRDLSVRHDKLQVHVVDFDKIDEWKDALRGDVLFSALGTTLKQAGSQDAQWKIDYTYQYEVARAAHENGVPTMSLVSSAWATADSKLFYTRMKGQLEKDVKKLGFKSVTIMRPPSLIRKDTDRFGERVSVKLLQGLNKIGILRSIRPMPTSQVAHAMISLAKDAKEGIATLEPKDIWMI
ncbi:MAG: NAD(P)H-binding protein [Paludibacteraceae bacterium]|nr:NAD(P)H-binding protein [Paludibacteraceae bacterium]